MASTHRLPGVSHGVRSGPHPTTQTLTADRAWPCPSPTGLAWDSALRPPPPSVPWRATDRWGGDLKVQAEGTQRLRCSQPGPSPAWAPLLGKKRTKTNLAVIKQLSGNQIIPRIEKPINKGAVKTNKAAGAARKR